MAKENVFTSLLDYIINYSGIAFTYPDYVTDESEKPRMQDIVDAGRRAEEDLREMSYLIIQKAGFGAGNFTSWHEDEDHKTRAVLVLHMRYADYGNIPVSVSIFAEKCGEDKSRLRVALNISDPNADKNIVDVYHKFLTLPVNIDSGLKLAAGLGEWGAAATLSMSWGEAKAKADRGEFTNVQLCKYIDRTGDESEEYYVKEILNAVNLLKPYYEKAIGIS